MASGSNEAVIRRFFDQVLAQGSGEAAAELLAPDFVAHHPLSPVGLSAAAMAEMMAGFRAAFPDLRYSVDDLFGEGDRVAARWTARARTRGI